MNKKKFGFDIHGVLDDLPETFVALNNALYDAGHEIHILTGSHGSEKVYQQLRDIGIKWHKFFSISDYHKEKSTTMWYADGLPWIDKAEWDKTKGEYCLKEGIDLHFDDTPEYETYFKTPFARVWTKNNRNGRGLKVKSEFITDAALNAAGFIYEETWIAEWRESTGNKSAVKGPGWRHNIRRRVVDIGSECPGEVKLPIFTYYPKENKLYDFCNNNFIQPTTMRDIKEFMETHKPKDKPKD